MFPKGSRRSPYQGSAGSLNVLVFPAPIMGAGASLHHHNAGRLRGQEPKQPRPREALAQQHMAGGIRPMRLENVLRDVQPNRDSLLHGRLLQITVLTPSLWYVDAVGGRPPSPGAVSYWPCWESLLT